MNNKRLLNINYQHTKKKSSIKKGLQIIMLILTLNVHAYYSISFAALKFSDSGTDDISNWKDKWFVDGKDYKVEYTNDGMKLTAAHETSDKNGAVCLWTIPSFDSEYLRIEYDFTKLDDLKTKSENVLIIQATGIGGAYPEDISKWKHHAHLNDSSMHDMHTMKMHNFSISYSTTGDDSQANILRGRHNKGFVLLKEYSKIKSFQTGISYHVIVEKEALKFSMKTVNKNTGAIEYFSFSGRKPDRKNYPAIKEGRIGMCQTAGRVSLFKNIKVYDAKK